jgi:anti-sigma factor RsiW
MDHEQCRHLLSSLSDYVDGVLESELCSEIERHMQGCEKCRVVVDSLRKTITLYHEAATPAEVPTEVRERLLRRLNLDDFIQSGAPSSEADSQLESSD